MAYGAWVGVPGIRFAAFGRIVAVRALLDGNRSALDMWFTPVNIVRYWEFAFVSGHLPRRPSRCLDVGSPRLFSYYALSRLGARRVRVLNPDVRDADLTGSLGSSLGLHSLVVDPVAVSVLAFETERYDAIWSISVIEHIPDDGDTEAMRLMYEALDPGGHMLVTVPVDRTAWDEYRDTDTYGLGQRREAGGYFFQRWYDLASLQARLIEPVQPSSFNIEWFGERVAGRFAAYERDWQARGHRRTVDDPREIANWYRQFDRWEAMPGQGVCGIAMRKAA